MPFATGGNLTQISISGVTYNVHTFTTSENLNFAIGGTVEYLIVAGGGGGGSTDGGDSRSGGGGAGGFLTGNISVNSNQICTVVVGAGGSVVGGTSGNNGGNSAVLFSSNVVAIGGGGGAGNGNAGRAGGSGGGGGAIGSAGNFGGGLGTIGPPRQGYDGGTGGTDSVTYRNGGGGGGAGQVGFNAGTFTNNSRGGDGLQSSITGTSVYYAGGGGGGTPGAGGLGGGGAGGNTTSTAGTANTGGGGGGCGPYGRLGATGGSGIVIIRYAFEPLTIADNSGGVGGPNAGGGGGAGGYTITGLGGGAGRPGANIVAGWSAAAGSGGGGGGASSATVGGGGGGIDLFGISFFAISGQGGNVSVGTGGRGGSPVPAAGIVGIGAQPGDDNGNGGLFGGGGGGVVGSVLDPTKGNGARGGVLVIYRRNTSLNPPTYPRLFGNISSSVTTISDTSVTFDARYPILANFVDEVNRISTPVIVDNSPGYISRPAGNISPAVYDSNDYTQSSVVNQYSRPAGNISPSIYDSNDLTQTNVNNQFNYSAPIVVRTIGYDIDSYVQISPGSLNTFVTISRMPIAANNVVSSTPTVVINSQVNLMLRNTDPQFTANFNTAYNYQTIQQITENNDPRKLLLRALIIQKGITGASPTDPQEFLN